MTLDLPTLVLVRMGADVLIALAFWAQARRYPSIRGPGWWSLASVASLLGSLGLWLRAGGGPPQAAILASLAVNASVLMVWLGLRSYLRLPLPLRLVALTMGALTLAHAGLYAVSDGLGTRFVLFSLPVLVAATLALRDLQQVDGGWQVPEFNALRLLTVFEGAVLLALAAVVVASGLVWPDVMPAFLFAFLMTKLLRAVLYAVLVSLRLRRDAEQARHSMASREAEWRALVENLGAGVIVFRPDHSVVTINSAARRFLGLADQGVVHMLPVWKPLRESGQRMPRPERPFERVLATGRPVSDMVLGFHQPNAPALRWALCNAYPENDVLGGLQHVVFTFVDITSLKQAQAEREVLEQHLAQSQKMEALGTLAGGVAHDFNNILAAILGNADLARQDVGAGSPAQESLHEISAAARRGRELVRQILAFSRQQPLERMPVEPATIVNETCALLRTAITPQVQLFTTIDPATPALRADATQLGQVLLNLGTNAIHALEGRSGRIEYQVRGVRHDAAELPAEVAQTCRQDGVDAVCITVADDGCGMDEATRARIFEPFFTTKAVGRGTGLGLSVVLGIVQAHGGAIEVCSGTAEGTRFSLYFPGASAMTQPASVPAVTATAGEGAPAPAEAVTMSADPVPASPEVSPMAETPATPRHILYLDDDDTLVFLVRRLLERRGYQVSAFTDQQEAIDAVRAAPERFDLLMTDYNMPGMSGLDVARAVRAISPGLPVAVASGYISDELQSEADAVGVAEVVFKTDAVEAFCEVVARLVRPAAA